MSDVDLMGILMTWLDEERERERESEKVPLFWCKLTVYSLLASPCKWHDDEEDGEDAEKSGRESSQ